MNSRKAGCIEQIIRYNKETVVKEFQGHECSAREEELKSMCRADCMDDDRPFVVRGFAKNWQCVQQWSNPSYLKKKAAEEKFFAPKRKYKSATVPEDGLLSLTNGKCKMNVETLDSFFNSSGKRYLLGIHDPYSGTLCPIQKTDKEKKQPSLREDIPPNEEIEFLKWFGRLHDHNEFFMAREHAYTNLHWDGYKNIYVAVEGQRVWYIAHPMQGEWLRPKGAGDQSNFSPSQPNLLDFSSHEYAKYVRFEKVVMNPGDILCVPARWWHLVESIPAPESRLSIAFNYFWINQMSGKSNPELSLRDLPRCSAGDCSEFRGFLSELPARVQATCKKDSNVMDVALALYLISREESKHGHTGVTDDIRNDLISEVLRYSGDSPEVKEHVELLQKPEGSNQMKLGAFQSKRKVQARPKSKRLAQAAAVEPAPVVEPVIPPVAEAVVLEAPAVVPEEPIPKPTKKTAKPKAQSKSTVKKPEAKPKAKRAATKKTKTDAPATKQTKPKKSAKLAQPSSTESGNSQVKQKPKTAAKSVEVITKAVDDTKISIPTPFGRVQMIAKPQESPEAVTGSKREKVIQDAKPKRRRVGPAPLEV